MNRRRITTEQQRFLKFEDCVSCRLALTSACRSCDMGENFEEGDAPDEICDLMDLWE